jgi:hypothetical protein
MLEKGLKAGAGEAGAEGPGEAGVEPNVKEGALLASPFCCVGLAGDAPKLKDVPEGVDAPKLKPDGWAGAKAGALAGCDWPKEKEAAGVALAFAGAFGGKLCEVDMVPKGLFCAGGAVCPKLKLEAAGGAGALCPNGLLSAPPNELPKLGAGLVLDGEDDLDEPGRPLRGLMLDKQRVSGLFGHCVTCRICTSLTFALPTEQPSPCAVDPLLCRGDPPFHRISPHRLVRLLLVSTWPTLVYDGDDLCCSKTRSSESSRVQAAVACCKSRLVVLDGHMSSCVSRYTAEWKCAESRCCDDAHRSWSGLF